MPTLRVGLHLVLVEGKPVLPAAAVPDLVDENGNFRNDMARAGAAMFFLPQSASRSLPPRSRPSSRPLHATGLKLDHVNAHKHFHLHPTIAALIVKFGRPRMGPKARACRWSRKASWRGSNRTSLRAWWRLTAPFARRLRRRFRSAGIRAPDHVFGLAWSGAMTRHG